MSDDPSAAADPQAGRNDLYARLRDLQDEVDSGLTAAQVEDAVGRAVATVLPALVSEAVASAVAGAVPSITRAVGAEVGDRVGGADGDGVEVRLAALEDALDGLADRLEALARDQASTARTSLEDLRAQLADLRGPAGEQADGGPRRRDDIDALREDLADALDYVRTTLAGELSARTAETQAAIQALAEEMSARSAPDPQPLADRLAAVDRRLDEMVDSIARSDARRDLAPVHERLDLLQDLLPDPGATSGLARLEERLDAVARGLTEADASPAVARLEERVEALSQRWVAPDLSPVVERLDSLHARLADGRIGDDDMETIHVRFDALLAAVDAAARSAADRTAEDSQRIHAALAEARDTDALERSLDARLAAFAAAVRDQVLDVRTDMATTAGELLSLLAAVRERPQPDVAGPVQALVAEVARLADAPAPVDHGPRIAALAEGIAALDRSLVDTGGRLTDLDDRMEALRSDLLDALDQARSALDDRVAGARTDLRAEMAETSRAQRAASEGVREAQEVIIARLDQLAGHPMLSGAVDVGAELAGVRADLADVLAAQERLALAGRENAMQAAEESAARAAVVQERFAELGRDLHEAVDGFPGEVSAWRTETAEDRAHLAAALSQWEAGRAELEQMVTRLGEQGADAAASVQDAAEAALAEMRRLGASAAEEMRREAVTAAEEMRREAAAAGDDARREAAAVRAAAGEQADAARQDAIEAIRTAASTALEDVRAAVLAQADATRAATEEMERIAHRVQNAGRLVVSYLAERDAALEEVRDRDTVQLLEDVLSSVSRKEREKVAGQARGLLARRRESRQAERWRQHQEGKGDPDLVSDEDALLELLDVPAEPPAAEPAPDGPPPAGAAPTDPAAVAVVPAGPDAPESDPRARSGPAATKAPAKKAPAKRAPATKAPAQKAPAKRAPAKKAPAKRAPAKQAPTLHAGTAPAPDGVAARPSGPDRAGVRSPSGGTESDPGRPGPDPADG
ncbi:MAG TPA: hypothetical protein VF288_05755 [Mycobacteriales bacterium]